MLNKDYEKGLCAVEVSGESCANCLTLLPVLTSIVSSRDDIKLVHIEADETTVQFMLDYDVRQVPTILLMDNGVVFARAVGFQPEEILELWLDAKIEEHKKSTK